MIDFLLALHNRFFFFFFFFFFIKEWFIREFWIIEIYEKYGFYVILY